MARHIINSKVSQARIHIPKLLLNLINIYDGDTVEIILNDDKTITIKQLEPKKESE